MSDDCLDDVVLSEREYVELLMNTSKDSADAMDNLIVFYKTVNHFKRLGCYMVYTFNPVKGTMSFYAKVKPEIGFSGSKKLFLKS